MTTAIVSRKPLVNHCAVVTEMRRSSISAGSATLMIVSLRIITNAEPTSSQITSDAPAVGVVCGSVPGSPVAGAVIESSCGSRAPRRYRSTPTAATELAVGEREPLGPPQQPHRPPERPRQRRERAGHQRDGDRVREQP